MAGIDLELGFMETVKSYVTGVKTTGENLLDPNNPLFQLFLGYGWLFVIAVLIVLGVIGYLFYYGIKVLGDEK